MATDAHIASPFEDLVTREFPARRVVVYPSKALADRQRLRAALEQAFNVTFLSAGEEDAASADAVLVFGSRSDGPVSGSAPKRTMVFESTVSGGSPGGSVRFSEDAQLDPRLRRRTLQEDIAVLDALPAQDDGVMLAFASAGPIWARSVEGRAVVDTVSILPVELSDGETLRDHLMGGRFAGLLPLVCFLREITAVGAWQPPPIRAAFIFDDPNLHWSSYGYVNFGQLVRSADRHDYHAVMAMVPLDGWFVHGRALARFSQSPRRLSLAVHGNAHGKRELARPRSAAAANRLVAQALRRIAAFERRTGLDVDRVMVPPHGACSRAASQAIRDSGFEATCIGCPYPWVARWGDSEFKHPPPWRPLTGFGQADVVDGLPTLLRQTFRANRDDLVLRAFLDQPLLLYGHHGDLAEGLGIMEDAADLINGLAPVRWMSLAAISRSNFDQLQDGSVLWVRSASRRIVIDVPHGVDEIRVWLPWWLECQEAANAVISGVPRSKELVPICEGTASISLDGTSKSSTVDLLIPPLKHTHAGGERRPHPNPWLFSRRVASEARDRLTPLAHTVVRQRSPFLRGHSAAGFRLGVAHFLKKL